MFNQSFNENNSINELRNRIEIIKLKRIIDGYQFNQKFKNEINNYLFTDDDKFNEVLLINDLHLNDLITIIKNSLSEFENSSQDIMLFKDKIKFNIKNFYNNIQKPVNPYEIDSLGIKNEVNFITPYIVLDNRTGDDYSIISQKIYEYKEYDWHIDDFTVELMKAVSYLSNNEIDEDIENLALVCLPRSTKGEISTIQKSIDIIEKWYNDGITDFYYNCSKNIINSKGLLTRFRTIERSSKGAHLTEEDHLTSIKCNLNSKLDLDNTVFILMDDITTYGKIMHACRKLLKKENIKADKIHMLAIGGTRSY